MMKKALFMGLFFYVLGAGAMEVKDPLKEQAVWQAFFLRQNDKLDEFLEMELFEYKRNEFRAQLMPRKWLTPE